MAFDDIVRAGVALADTLTASLQAVTTYSRRTGQDHAGNPTYAASVTVNAVVEYKTEQRILSDGRVAATRAKLTLPRSFTVAMGDKFVLPDGSSSPIVDIVGVCDPDTGLPYATEIVFGVDRTVS